MFRYTEEYRRKLLRKRNIKERKERIMPEDFKFSPILRNDEKEKFLESEEKLREALKTILDSNIHFKNRLGSVIVEITKPDGEVVKDILRLDNMNYNYCVKLIKLALGVEKWKNQEC